MATSTDDKEQHHVDHIKADPNSPEPFRSAMINLGFEDY